MRGIFIILFFIMLGFFGEMGKDLYHWFWKGDR